MNKKALMLLTCALGVTIAYSGSVIGARSGGARSGAGHMGRTSFGATPRVRSSAVGITGTRATGIRSTGSTRMGSTRLTGIRTAPGTRVTGTSRVGTRPTGIRTVPGTRATGPTRVGVSPAGRPGPRHPGRIGRFGPRHRAPWYRHHRHWLTGNFWTLGIAYPWWWERRICVDQWGNNMPFEYCMESPDEFWWWYR